MQSFVPGSITHCAYCGKVIIMATANKKFCNKRCRDRRYRVLERERAGGPDLPETEQDAYHETFAPGTLTLEAWQLIKLTRKLIGYAKPTFVRNPIPEGINMQDDPEIPSRPYKDGWLIDNHADSPWQQNWEAQQRMKKTGTPLVQIVDTPEQIQEKIRRAYELQRMNAPRTAPVNVPVATPETPASEVAKVDNAAMNEMADIYGEEL